jgi:hypothetical protein
MNNKLNDIENLSTHHLLKIKDKKGQLTLKNNNEKGDLHIPKFKIEWNNKNIINVVSEVSRADWWRRWLYSTNAKDIGMLYIYFAIFSGILIMPLKKNLVIYWNNCNINNIIILINNIIYNSILYNIKSVSILNIYKYYIIYKYYRDFKQELLLLLSYLYIIKIISLKENYLKIKSRFYSCIDNKGKLFKKKMLNNQLGPYLAGLIESDGSIIIPKENSQNTPTISIVFHIDDKPLTIHLCVRLGYGSLEELKYNKAVKLYIRGKYSILKTVSLINGKFRTPKIEKLHKLIVYINKNWNEQIKDPYSLLPIDNTPIYSNSWFAGFSDGDANININISWPDKAKNKYGQIRLTFEIVQTRMKKEHFYKYKSIMTKIAIFLKSKLGKHSVSKYDRSGKQDTWRARVVNK